MTARDKRLERAIKAKIKAVLDRYVKDGECWYQMVVPSGYGAQGLDFTVCFRGWFVSIETKRPQGGTLTGRQSLCMMKQDAAGGIVLFAADDDDVMAVIAILEKLPKLIRPVPSMVEAMGLKLQDVKEKVS